MVAAATLAAAMLPAWQVPEPPAVHTSQSTWTFAVAEALIMTGTAMPEVTRDWMSFASSNFIEPTAGPGYLNTPVRTPAQFRPITGLDSLTLDDSTRIGSGVLGGRIASVIAANRKAGTPDDPIAVFGYSQSAWIASIQKRLLVDYKERGGFLPDVDFVLLANPVRPNGGVFSRILGHGLVTWNPLAAAPTDTPFASHDVSRQYDFFSDFPMYPVNFLAVINAVFGLLNHDYSPVSLDPRSPNYDPDTVVQKHGDTTYYTIPSKLPMLAPLRLIGLGLLADVIEPVLRVLVELGYERDIPYGEYTTFRPLPRIDFRVLRDDLQAAWQEGLAVLHEALTPATPPAAPAPSVHREPRSMSSAPRPAGPGEADATVAAEAVGAPDRGNPGQAEGDGAEEPADPGKAVDSRQATRPSDPGKAVDSRQATRPSDPGSRSASAAVGGERAARAQHHHRPAAAPGRERGHHRGANGTPEVAGNERERESPGA